MNKRGQEMSTTTIVLLILAVIVLVVLIIGFTMGWSKVLPWVSSNNVNSIVTACAIACATGDTYNFCTAEKELNDGTNKTKTNCATFSVFSRYSQYGIDECNTIKCDLSCKDIMVGGVAAEEKLATDSCPEGYEDITFITSAVKCCAKN